MAWTFFKLETGLASTTEIPWPEKAVAAYLTSLLRHGRKIRVSIQHLAAVLGMSPGMVEGCIATLQSREFLRVDLNGGWVTGVMILHKYPETPQS